jgi:hypothetical protein
MGIQAPARKAYCPNFLKTIDAVAKDPRTAKNFAGFKPPWLFHDTPEEYSAMFCKAGFSVPFAKIEEVATRHESDVVMPIFESGAIAGYLNQDYYAAPIDDAYAAAFRKIVNKSFLQQAEEDGKVELIFNRIYLAAKKE